MAFDAYFIIDKASEVKGEATAEGLDPAKGWIHVTSFSWGASNPTTVSTGTGGLAGGKAQISSFNFTKYADDASAYLFKALTTGKHYAGAELVVRKSIGDADKLGTFIKYTFTDVMVENIQWGGSSGGDDTPTESVSVAFAGVKYENFTQDTAKGTLKAGSLASWSLTKASSKV